ncbi:PepSY domain-containing protein [Chthonobacter rhizosphaerae]|uniref:PepSY domain-containing protein n=1 Tax=Chthonobacter rhizosphaerae TaxID=2735553 RepID=UPI0015EEDB2C|nr:PepSY domain-containing protein [Chthonobacter rhizosphaerae]
MMKKTASIMTAAAILVGSSSAVLSQAIELGPNGVRVVPPQEERIDRVIREDEEVTAREAARIARGAGIDEVDEIQTRRNSYRVVGIDRRGRDIEVDVSRRTGEILDVNRI